VSEGVFYWFRGGFGLIEVKTKPISWSRLSVETIDATRLTVPEVSLYPLAKRLMDITVAGIAFIALLPVMALIALAIKLDSPGPAIFQQRRVGRWGRDFVIYKFRSMRVDADEQVHREFATNYINGHTSTLGTPSASGQVVFKPNGDNRVTRVGKWLRQTSLDELPNLLNVLMGEMSLVGPRPVVRYEVEQYSKEHLQRLAVLPGMTGLPQVSGRGKLTVKQAVRLDLDYIERRSLGLDLAILVRTIPVVFMTEATA
jgi:lipopolysaccharide/colanic/teichoic acid biosynthesis glycosyltransferase